MAQGNAQGITWIASSGDSGALSAVPVVCFNYGPDCGSAEPSAEFPASSPHVTGVGGTNLITTYNPPSLESKYIREEAFGDPLAEDIFYGTSATGFYWGSGGGDSILFRKPAFQAGINTGNAKFRTVPDLALHMGGCPAGTITTCDPRRQLRLGGHRRRVRRRHRNQRLRTRLRRSHRTQHSASGWSSRQRKQLHLHPCARPAARPSHQRLQDQHPRLQRSLPHHREGL